MNSAEQTGINGTNQNVGSISTGSNYPTLQVGKSYLVEGHFHYIGTASVPGNVVAIVVDWTGSGSATHTDWAAQHWEDGGQVINNVGNSSTNPFTNAQGSNSYGSIASLPFTSFGPGMHTNLNPSYSIRLSGGSRTCRWRTRSRCGSLARWRRSRCAPRRG